MSNSNDSNFFDELPDWVKMLGGFAVGTMVLAGGVALINKEMEEISNDASYILQKIKRNKNEAFFAIDKLVREPRYKVGETGSDMAWSHFKSELTSKASSELFVRDEDVQEILSYGERERRNI